MDPLCSCKQTNPKPPYKNNPKSQTMLFQILEKAIKCKKGRGCFTGIGINAGLEVSYGVKHSEKSAPNSNMTSIPILNFS